MPLDISHSTVANSTNTASTGAGPTSAASVRPPFVLESRSLNLHINGTFTPDAAVLLTPALLQSGLLLEITPTQLQTLLLVLCSVTSNGTFVATSEALASHLRLWPGQMRARLEQLAALQWQGEPLLRCQNTETGLRLFAPSPLLFESRRVLLFPAPDRPGVPLERPAVLQQDGARIVGGLREAVVEHSRASYGRPRAEVEAQINHFLSSARETVSWPGSKTAPNNSQMRGSSGLNEGNATSIEPQVPLTSEEQAQQEVAERLIAVGLSIEQARHFVQVHPLEVIERQLYYLPYRHARSPVGMLVASIEGDYAPPLAAPRKEVPPVAEPPAEVPLDDGIEEFNSVEPHEAAAPSMVGEDNRDGDQETFALEQLGEGRFAEDLPPLQKDILEQEDDDDGIATGDV